MEQNCLISTQVLWTRFKLEELKLSLLQSVMEQVDGIENKEQLIKYAEFRTLGISSLFGVYVGQDDKQSGINTLPISIKAD